MLSGAVNYILMMSVENRVVRVAVNMCTLYWIKIIQYSCSVDAGVTISVLGNSFVCSRKGEVVKFQDMHGFT